MLARLILGITYFLCVCFERKFKTLYSISLGILTLPPNRYMLETSDYPDFEEVAEVEEIRILAGRLRSTVKEVAEALAAVCKWDPRDGGDASPE